MAVFSNVRKTKELNYLSIRLRTNIETFTVRNSVILLGGEGGLADTHWADSP